MNIAIENIAKIINAECNGSLSESIIDGVSIDSRSLQNDKYKIFFALIGKNHDSHNYIKDLIEKGVRNFVVSYIPNDCEGKASFFIVKNTLDALQTLAAYYRKSFNLKIIGLTGSNGKTIVKEWLNFLLNPDFNIIRSPKSYNSQIGVPLSVFGITQNHNLGIFEAGISTTMEMENLEKIIKPDIVVLTNIGSAHNEGFKDLEEKLTEKLKLIKDSKILICCKDYITNANLLNKIIFAWSFNDSLADVFILDKQIVGNNTVIKYKYDGVTFNLEIPFNDKASIENIINCLMVLLYLKYDFKNIQGRILMLYPVEMRLRIKNGINNCRIIDDSYSSDYESFKIALDFLESQKQYSKKTLIISDFIQSGWTDTNLYSKVAQLVISNNIDRVICIGKSIASYSNLFPNCTNYEDTKSFLSHYNSLTFENETILIKGARIFKFEDIVSLLEEKKHETVLEINLNSISYNLNYYKSKLKTETKLMVMVKAFGYGSGGYDIAKLLEYHKVDYLGVAFADEGIDLRKAGIKTPIMVMNPDKSSFNSIIQYQLEPEIYSINILQAFLKKTAEQKIVGYPIHLKLDTGMHRLGFMYDDIAELTTILIKNNTVSIKSILSHLATSDELEKKDFVLYQINLFKKLSSKLIDSLSIKPIRHILNTAGISNFPEHQYDMVRLGIGLYGISNNSEEQKELQLVGTLKTVISQIHLVPKGESIGYGRNYFTTESSTVATIPIGYADGIRRMWGNGVGYVTINNMKAPILGSICMDMLMVDVSAIDCREGDCAIVLGESPTVTEMAEKLRTIPYEVLTAISQRVKRIFYRE